MFEEIERFRKDGESFDLIGKRYGLTRQRIFQIYSQYKKLTKTAKITE